MSSRGTEGGAVSYMTFERVCRYAHVRSAIRRASKPHLKYWKNHQVPLSERVPVEDQRALDWEEYDPRDHEECSAFNETPA